jgi:hypothetical protein
MLRSLRAAVLILPLLLAPPAFAEEESTPGDLAVEGLEKMLRAIELFVEAIPMYAPPELLPNGDIIIRRLDREERDSEPRQDDGEGEGGVTET